jgi:hypothetical protein
LVSVAAVAENRYDAGRNAVCLPGAKAAAEGTATRRAAVENFIVSVAS